MTSGNQWREEKRRRRAGLTPLNDLTSARYARCEADGGHRPSGDSVMRFFPTGPRELPICRRCRVPYGGPSRSWTSNSRGGRA